MAYSDEFSDLKRTHTIRSVLNLSDNKRWMVCPLPGHLHHENTASFSIYIGDDGLERFRCHGNCGARGDVVDLIGFMQIAGYDPTNRTHVAEAARILRGSFTVVIAVAKEKPSRIDPLAWKKYFPAGQEVAAYAKKRGLSEQTLTRFRVGQYQNFMAIPTFEDQVLEGIKFRNVYEKDELAKMDLDEFQKLRFSSEPGGRKSIFNIDKAAWSTDPLLIVKGEIPCMLLDQLGFNVCGLNAGEGQKADKWVRKLALAAKRVFVGDNDYLDVAKKKAESKGFRSAEDMALARADELIAELRFPPRPYKDIDQWILADPAAVEEIKSWLI